MADYFSFLWARFQWACKGSWGVSGTASTLIGFAIGISLWCAPKWTHEHISDRMNAFLIGLVPIFTGASVFLCRWVYSSYVLFRAGKDKVAEFEERMKPKIKVSGDMQTENCFTTGNGIAYFRPRLDSLGMEPIFNVEAHIIAIRKEGVSVPVGEYAQLMMHPGIPTLAALKYKVPGFIDVIKTNPQGGQPMLALAWPYASVDRWIVASEDTYEIDITISSTSAPPKDFTFVFKWGGNPFTSTFSVREIPGV